MLSTTRSGMTSLPSFSGKNAVGVDQAPNLAYALPEDEENSHHLYAARRWNPAQPPANAAKSRRKGAKEGHALKSAVVKPVVVVMETAWNIPIPQGMVGRSGMTQEHPDHKHGNGSQGGQVGAHFHVLEIPPGACARRGNAGRN